MATDQTRLVEFGRRFGAEASEIFYGADGPGPEHDIDAIEDTAVAVARAAFDACVGRALELQNQKLPAQLPCPGCGKSCPVKYESRTIRARLGPARICEPVCRCSACDRDFFPSAGNVTLG